MKSSVKTASPLILIALLLACFAIRQSAHAVVPAPDGGYPGFNTAEGQNALFSLTTGVANTGVGWYSLFSNIDGSFNTAVGAGTLLFNVGDQSTGEGVQNTAVGGAVLLFNTTGFENTAVGATALLNNTTGSSNTAVGNEALSSNTTADFITATGFQALHNNTTGPANTATGAFALNNLTTGANNAAIGNNALANSTDGASNTAIGASALVFLFVGNGNIALGTGAGGTLNAGDFNIYIGNQGVPTESNTIRIGDEAVQTATYIAGINGQTATDGVAVYIDSDGKLGTLTSSARFKTDIKPMDESSEAILALKPVTFRYKQEIDPKGIPQFGLVAEEVETVNPDLVARDADGKPYTVRYEQINAMLLNEFLKEHRKIEKLEATVAQQHKDFEAAVAELKGQIQKVSAQLELSKAAPQTVNNP
jgi:hypothetical protein